MVVRELPSYPLSAILAAWRVRWPEDSSAHLDPVAVATLFSLPLFAAAIRIPFLLSVRIRIRDYARHALLSMALAWYAMLRICMAVLASVVSPSASFDVTRKTPSAVTLRALATAQWPLAPFALLVAAGFHSTSAPVGYAAAWLGVICGAPLLLWLFHDRESVDVEA